jgi:hypothetical protein
MKVANLDDTLTQRNSSPQHGRKRVSIGRFSVPLPDSRPLRIVLGVALVLGGLVGFLPILGFWMVPLGLLVLSHDIPAVRRLRRKAAIRWMRWRHKRKSARERRAAEKKRAGGESGPKALGNGGVSSREDEGEDAPVR